MSLRSKIGAKRAKHQASLAERSRFISSLYRELLGRTPEPEEVAHWLINSEHLSAERVYSAFVGSDEYKARAVRKAELIVSLFKELLKRDPEPDELATWIAHAERITPEQAYFTFVNSDEYQKKRDEQVNLYVAPGHFYSPIVDPRQLEQRSAILFARDRELPGIDLREKEQIAYLHHMAGFYDRIPFADTKQPGVRYFYRNDSFSYPDAIVLACTILAQRPRRIIEVGSGYSSSLILDIVEREFSWNVDCTFIEPYPDLFESFLVGGDREKIEVLAECVQDVDLSIFDRLEPNDILFIDSTHIVKTGSDVIHHITNVLPRIKPGVIIHFHDIFYPFEYPEQWVMEKNMSWNELYYLQAFLTNNREYEIMFFNSFMEKRHAALAEKLLPKFMKNSGGSLWLRKLE